MELFTQEPSSETLCTKTRSATDYTYLCKIHNAVCQLVGEKRESTATSVLILLSIEIILKCAKKINFRKHYTTTIFFFFFS